MMIEFACALALTSILAWDAYRRSLAIKAADHITATRAEAAATEASEKVDRMALEIQAVLDPLEGLPDRLEKLETRAQLGR